ncbi:MAG: protein translocase subunit SecD, partial [Gammaproteobacteria bacterium]|nr:protein translocase subunit SecD [Gammaproteobacteria bacterium]
MNQYPVWKYLLIVAVLVVGLFFALPNIYGNNPAVQVKADRDAPIDQILEGRLVDGLKSLDMEALRVQRDDRSLLLRFADENTQLKA